MNHELFSRYQDDYRSAASSVRFGKGLRAFGCLLGLAGVLLGLIAAGNGSHHSARCLVISGLVAALVLSVAGVFLATQGRILRSSLDTAVAANAVLSQHEKAQLMTLDV